MVRYAKPRSLGEALTLLGEGKWRVLAGGTDFYPALGAKPLLEDVFDINGLAALRGICDTAEAVVIGARANWTDIVRADLLPAFTALKQAAREVGSIQIQNTGTVAGNVCNASPAADGVPALLILDAEVEIASLKHRRTEPLVSFITGNRRIALRDNELVTAIRLPRKSLVGASSFFKLGARRYLVISIAMAAARLAVNDGVVTDAAIAVGACSAVAMRLRDLEQALVGRTLAAAVASPPDLEYLAGLMPIDDVRGSADYRRAAAREIVWRALRAAAESARGSAPATSRAA